MKPHRPVPALLALLALAGCAAADRAEVEPPGDPGALVLRVTELPGMLPPGGGAAVPPRFSLLADGRLIGPAGPAGAWPELVEHRVAPRDVTRLLRVAAGLPNQTESQVPDAPVLRVVTVSTGGRREVTVARTDPSAERLRAALAAHAEGTGVPYRPSAVAVIAVPDDPTAPAPPWPLPALTGAPLTGTGAGASCAVLRGGELETVRRAWTGPTVGRWRGGDAVWQVRIRPLLPDETDCADL
ncbi:hypothetical protein AB0J86_29630 [Micromonospora sp. NPDC049559]|uniref:hypothetical protein n=1 Tax=Micromonospora sp. NPDC049559 TaxID=3155923 RepID=UPI003416C425